MRKTGFTADRNLPFGAVLRYAQACRGGNASILQRYAIIVMGDCNSIIEILFEKRWPTDAVSVVCRAAPTKIID